MDLKKRLFIIVAFIFFTLSFLSILFFKTRSFGETPEIYLSNLAQAGKSGFGRLITQTLEPEGLKEPEKAEEVKKPEVNQATEAESKPFSQVIQKIKSSIAFLARLPTKIFLRLKPKKKTLYSENAQVFVVNFVKDDLKDDLNKLVYDEVSEETINNLSQQILSSFDESQKQIGQQIKLGKRKIEAKSSIKGEVMLPIRPGSWRLDVNPLSQADIWLPEQKIKIKKDSLGVLLCIPMKKGSGKLIFSDKVIPLPLDHQLISKSSRETNQTLAQYLRDPINQEQKIVLIMIFNDQNNNQFLDDHERLVPWAGVTFYLNKSLI